jgi:hypothetical protein
VCQCVLGVHFHVNIILLITIDSHVSHSHLFFSVLLSVHLLLVVVVARVLLLMTAATTTLAIMLLMVLLLLVTTILYLQRARILLLIVSICIIILVVVAAIASATTIVVIYTLILVIGWISEKWDVDAVAIKLLYEVVDVSRIVCLLPQHICTGANLLH